jgi:hypothetical protein
MKTEYLLVGILVLVVVMAVAVSLWAQTMGISVQPATSFATSISGCPTASAGFTICIVSPGNNVEPFEVLSVANYNNGQPFQPTVAQIQFNQIGGTLASSQLPPSSTCTFTASITGTGSTEVVGPCH